MAGVHTSKQRVLRLMREHRMLALQRQPQLLQPKRNEGAILAKRSDQMWGLDATAGFARRDGHVDLFAIIHQHPAYCLGIHVAKRRTRLEALEPVRHAVTEQFSRFWEGFAVGVMLRHDHGSLIKSDDFQWAIHILAPEPSASFHPEPEGNEYIERFLVTFEEQLHWMRHFETVQELAAALQEFRQRYNERWLIERLPFQSPRQARQAPPVHESAT